MSEATLSTESHAASISPSAATILEIQQQQRRYLAVYGVLIVGTILTVTMYYVHFDAMWQTVAVALAIAAVKGAFVAAVFMHLWHGERDIYRVILCTGIFAVVMLAMHIYSFFSLPGTGHYLR